MAEEKKQETSEKVANPEPKQSPPAAPVPPATPAPAAAAPPKAVPPRPAAQSPPPPPPSAPPRAQGRRTFMKALLAVGAVLSIVPFVPWGRYLSSSVTGGGAQRTLLQKVRVDAVPTNGQAGGMYVNVNDLTNFPAADPAKGDVNGNGHWIFTYPSSGDLTLDSQNPDTFVKFELIRLPTGTDKKATDFVAFSKVCVHLWCSPVFNPSAGHEQYECPCHGSVYRIPDGLSIAGPASLQTPPQNAIPMMTLQADSAGNLYVFYPNLDPSKAYPNDTVNPIEADGDIGFGRDYLSYENFIKPAAQLEADTAEANQVVGS